MEQKSEKIFRLGETFEQHVLRHKQKEKRNKNDTERDGERNQE